MPKHIERGNATQSKIRTCVEHVFGHQKGPMDLSIRTIGLERAATKMTLANLTYNMKRLIFHERRCTLGCVLNRPGFSGELLVQMLGCFFCGFQGFIEVLLCFLRRDVSDFAV